MNCKILIAFLMMTSALPAFAKDCGYIVVKMENLKKKYDAVDYAKTYLRLPAEKKSSFRDDASIALGDAMDDFNEIPKSTPDCRMKVWRALIEVVIATSPYIGDSAGVNFLAEHINDEKLGPVYSDMIQNTGEVCRRKFVAAMVTERNCVLPKFRDPKAVNACRAEDSQAKEIDKCLTGRQRADSGALEDFQGGATTSACLCGSGMIRI